MPYADPARQRAAHNEACARWRAKSAKRYAAQQAVKAAIKTGRLVRWPGCAACHRKRGLEAHHADYDRPLDVVWLCMKCHKAAHAIVGFRNTDRERQCLSNAAGRAGSQRSALHLQDARGEAMREGAPYLNRSYQRFRRASSSGIFSA
jgi:mono/diheme cytochrome c family protein